MTSGNRGTGPVRDREVLLSSISILLSMCELGTQVLGMLNQKLLDPAPSCLRCPLLPFCPSEDSCCLEKFSLWLIERARLLPVLAEALIKACAPPPLRLQPTLTRFPPRPPFAVAEVPDSGARLLVLHIQGEDGVLFC